MRLIYATVVLLGLTCTAWSSDLTRDQALRVLQKKFSEPSYSKVRGLVELSTWFSGSLMYWADQRTQAERCVTCFNEKLRAIMRTDNAATDYDIAAINKEMDLSLRPSQIRNLKRLFSLGIVERFSFTHPSVIVRAHLTPEAASKCPDAVNDRSGQAGEVTCQFDAGTRTASAVTGIRQFSDSGNPYIRVEFSVGYKLATTVDEWCTSKPPPTNNVAIFASYDDGWRITGWDVLPDKWFDCSTGKETKP